MANTIRFRRRKGTLAVLELLANASAGWPARAVEYYQLLILAQAINFLHLERGRSVDLRDGDALDRLDGPFDEIAHFVDVRRPDSHRTSGRYNITSVGLFVWRLRAYKVTRTEAYCLEQINSQSYSFSILGNDTPLFTPATSEAEPPRSPGEMDLPAPIRRWPFEQRTTVGSTVVRQASPLYYGPGKPVTIWAENWPVAGAPQPIPASSVIPADLSGWVYRAPRDHVVVDPVLGRIVFPARQLPKDKVFVSYYYGFSSEIGGGEYERPLSQPADYKIYYVGEGETYTRISDALDQWKTDKPFNAVIEITDGGVYVEQLDISLLENHSLQLRAANKKRPVLRVLDWRTSAPDSLRVTGEAGSWFTLDGLLVTGRGLQVDGALAGVPGWGLHCDCEPWRPSEPSVVLNEDPRCLRVEHSILGSIQVNREEVREDPGKIHISDTILDATSPQEEALCAPEETIANVILRITRSTVIGRMCLHELELGENSIFYGIVTVARRQTGCVRFSYVTPGSRTPRRYSCQPDLAQASVPVEFRVQEAERLRPRFNSLRYGQPAYCQLADDCALEIKRGADDESEMGVFHDLFQPQREANLRVRLDEYTSAGMNQGIFFVT